LPLSSPAKSTSWSALPVATLHGALLTAALSVAMAAVASAQALPIVDFTVDPRAQIGYTMPADERDALFQRLYPQDDNCEESLDGEMNAVNGSFTHLNANEAFITFISWRGCAHAGQHGNIVLMSGPEIVLWSNSIDSGTVEAVEDIFGNGLDEVIVSYTDGGQGEFHTEAATLGFKDRKINSFDFVSGTVARSECGSTDGKEYASIFYRNQATIIQENFVKQCADGRPSYSFYSYGKLQ
jgi:hypothetical protein